MHQNVNWVQGRIMSDIILFSISREALQNLIREAVKSEAEHFNEEKHRPQNKLLSRKMAAAMLGCSLVTLGTWCKEGRLPFLRLGSKVYFREEEVLKSLVRGRGVNQIGGHK